MLTVSAIADSDGVCGAVGPDLFLSGDNVTLTDDSFAFFSNFGPVVKIATPVWTLPQRTLAVVMPS